MSFEVGGRCSYANATLGMEVEARPEELTISSGRVLYRPDEKEEAQVVLQDFEPPMSAEPEEPLIRID